MMRKTWKMTKTLANGYSFESAQRELSNEYQHDRVSMVLENLCILVLWTKVASALEGLTWIMHAWEETNFITVYWSTFHFNWRPCNDWYRRFRFCIFFYCYFCPIKDLRCNGELLMVWGNLESWKNQHTFPVHWKLLGKFSNDATRWHVQRSIKGLISLIQNQVLLLSAFLWKACPHGLSQQGVWVSFWTPKSLKSTPQDTQILLWGISIKI